LKLSKKPFILKHRPHLFLLSVVIMLSIAMLAR